MTGTGVDIVMLIMNAKTVVELPLLINERIVDHIIEKVKNQFKNLIQKDYNARIFARIFRSAY